MKIILIYTALLFSLTLKANNLSELLLTIDFHYTQDYLERLELRKSLYPQENHQLKINLLRTIVRMGSKAPWKKVGQLYHLKEISKDKKIRFLQFIQNQWKDENSIKKFITLLLEYPTLIEYLELDPTASLPPSKIDLMCELIQHAYRHRQESNYQSLFISKGLEQIQASTYIDIVYFKDFLAGHQYESTSEIHSLLLENLPMLELISKLPHRSDLIDSWFNKMALGQTTLAQVKDNISVMFKADQSFMDDCENFFKLL